MKTLLKFIVLSAVVAVSFDPTAVRAQDAPPPPPDQGAPPPDPNNQGAPPPPGDQGPAPQDQGGDDQGASFQTFYDQLGDQGQWVQTDDYGYVFQPNVSDPNWAPYTDGHWVYTDVGWTWASDEPWGWATYHYGRWANIDGTGWVWVPGYRWAPAWVSWRYGGGYAGWAPLPPETFIGAEYGDGVGVGFHFGSDVDVNFNIGPGCYNFVQVGYLGDPNYRGHYLDRNRNYTVINNTTNITSINVRGDSGNFRGVNTGGPTLAQVNAHSHTPVRTVQLTAANQPGRSTLNGNSLAVFAPRVSAASNRTAKPTRVGQTIAHPTFNRGDSISKPMDVTSTVHSAAPSQEAIAAAKAAEAKAPATAHIANERTTIKTPMTTPLTSMRPVQQHSAATTPAVNNPGGQKSVTPRTDSSFTGETQKPVTHPQAEVAPRTESGSGAGSSAFTGEQQKPTSTYHPQTETTPVTHTQPVEKPVTHTEPQGGNGGQGNHPQDEFRPAQQPETHTQPQTAPTFHPQEAPVTHTQPAPQHEAAPAPQHTQAAPAAAPHATPPQGGGGGGNKDAKGNGNGPSTPQGH